MDCLLSIHPCHKGRRQERERGQEAREGGRERESARTHNCQSVAKVLSSDPARGTAASRLPLSWPLNPVWFPCVQTQALLTGGLKKQSGSALEDMGQQRSCLRKPEGPVASCHRCGSEPVLQRAIPSSEVNRLEKREGFAASSSWEGSSPLGSCWSPVYFRKYE